MCFMSKIYGSLTYCLTRVDIRFMLYYYVVGYDCKVINESESDFYQT